MATAQQRLASSSSAGSLRIATISAGSSSLSLPSVATDARSALASALASTRASPFQQQESDVLVRRDGRGEVWVLYNGSGTSARLRILISSASESVGTMWLEREPTNSAQHALERLASKVRLPAGTRIALRLPSGEERVATTVPESSKGKGKGMDKGKGGKKGKGKNEQSRPETQPQGHGQDQAASVTAAATATVERNNDAQDSATQAANGVEVDTVLSNDEAFVEGAVLCLGEEQLPVLRQVPVRIPATVRCGRVMRILLCFARSGPGWPW